MLSCSGLAFVVHLNSTPGLPIIYVLQSGIQCVPLNDRQRTAQTSGSIDFSPRVKLTTSTEQNSSVFSSPAYPPMRWKCQIILFFHSARWKHQRGLLLTGSVTVETARRPARMGGPCSCKACAVVSTLIAANKSFHVGFGSHPAKRPSASLRFGNSYEHCLSGIFSLASPSHHLSAFRI